MKISKVAQQIKMQKRWWQKLLFWIQFRVDCTSVTC